MNELLIIKTADAGKVKSVLTKNHVDYQIVYNEHLNSIPKTSQKDKLREYIEMKSQENIFADYGKALKNKELEAEKSLLENDLD